MCLLAAASISGCGGGGGDSAPTTSTAATSTSISPPTSTPIPTSSEAPTPNPGQTPVTLTTITPNQARLVAARALVSSDVYVVGGVSIASSDLIRMTTGTFQLSPINCPQGGSYSYSWTRPSSSRPTYPAASGDIIEIAGKACRTRSPFSADTSLLDGSATAVVVRASGVPYAGGNWVFNANQTHAAFTAFRGTKTVALTGSVQLEASSTGVSVFDSSTLSTWRFNHLTVGTVDTSLVVTSGSISAAASFAQTTRTVSYNELNWKMALVEPGQTAFVTNTSDFPIVYSFGLPVSGIMTITSGRVRLVVTVTNVGSLRLDVGNTNDSAITSTQTVTWDALKALSPL